MDFTFNDEQQQFADALRRYLDKSYDPVSKRARRSCARNPALSGHALGLLSPNWA